jgi:hypothetical protein
MKEADCDNIQMEKNKLITQKPAQIYILVFRTL